MNGMNESVKAPAGDGTRVANVDEFYVRRINWLITIGRADLIDEIADDCERRPTTPPAAGDRSGNTSAAVGPPHGVHHGQDVQTAPGAAGLPPRPVETGTRLAVARLRRSPRRAYRHMPESQSIRE